MAKILVDTDILIDFTKGHDDKLGRLLGKTELVLSPINVAEFLNNRELDSEAKKINAHDFLKLFNIVNMDREIGEKAGELLRLKKVEYLGDAIVAATCVVEKIELLTRNKRHFEKVPGLLDSSLWE